MMLGTWRFLLVVGLIPISHCAASNPSIGDTVADLRFKDIRTLPRSLADLGPKRAYVFVFTTTSCPLVRRSIPKLIELDSRYGPQDVQIVAVNVGSDDTIRDMAAQAIELEAHFPFVKDVNLSCAKALGVTRTPEVAVLNADKKLVYRGRIDDQLRLGGARPEPTRRDLEEALREILDGRAVAVAETPVDGCVIESPPSPPTDLPIPTYHGDVAPILQRRCVNCHTEGTAAPFDLQSYTAAVSHAQMMAEVVTDQSMPPWYANPRHGKFQNDPSLTKAERDTLVRWVNSGRVEGDAPEQPAATDLAPRWRIGKPDVVITMLEQHTVPATGFVPYRHALLPYVFFSDTWIEAIEIRPDNPVVVHHCNMAYASKDGVGEETFLTGHVPGGQPMDLGRFDNGVAVFVPRLAVLGLQIHYTTTGKEETCRISVGLRFPRRTVQKQLRHVLLDPHRIAIPPGDGAFAIRSQKTLDRDINLLGMFSHMHVRGKDMTFFATAPDQPRETLLQIPNYNFEWQLGYELEPGTKHLPRGTVLEAVAHYDNSAFNPYNPDPKRTVPWGQQTYDEMFNGFMFFVDDNESLNLTVDPKSGIVKRPKD
ncbi:MAG: redoxin family protein [Planctomycetes bacterium]|nr:redoxin family protein [Planctomycetota bacterium]